MSAILSPCGRYRYRLERGEGRKLAFVMLNPSTADADQDDPTIRRCRAFAAREGYGGIVVGNVYALRSTDPRALRDAANPFGENTKHLRRIAEEHAHVVVAWGSHVIPAHALNTCAILEGGSARLCCFGVTKGGQPKHPLYIAGAAPLVPYDPLNPWASA